MADPNGTPTRYVPFYERVYRLGTDTDQLTCVECKHSKVYAHAIVPAVGEQVPCEGCGLPSRIPTLPSQAGMAEPVDPPHNSERS